MTGGEFVTPTNSSHLPGKDNSWTICKVPHQLRAVNKNAYEPNVISIGPYHHGKKRLEAMEDIKQRCFDDMKRQMNLDSSRLQEAMRNLEERVRKSYEKASCPYKSDQLVKMLVIDGCFIVKLIREKYTDEDELCKLPPRIQTEIWYDLLLLENQLPFFVLEKLDRLIIQKVGGDLDEDLEESSDGGDLDEDLEESSDGGDLDEDHEESSGGGDLDEDHDEFNGGRDIEEGHDEFNGGRDLEEDHDEFNGGRDIEEGHDEFNGGGDIEEGHDEFTGGDIDEFVRKAIIFFSQKTEPRQRQIWSKTEICHPSKEGQRQTWSKSEVSQFSKENIKHLLDLVHKCRRPSLQEIKKQQDFKAKTETKKWKFIRNATELAEAGIKFSSEKGEDHDQDQVFASLFDIKFIEDKKELRIPALTVFESTECILRNFMAYEQFKHGKPTYVSDYVTFMDKLINTGKDVQLLRKKGIIDNWLGDDRAVAQMFNKLRNCTYMSEPDDFFYSEIFGQVDKHCKRTWNEWKAILKRDYFNTPWSFIKFLAAVVLLLLTLLQTIFSVLSYIYQGGN